MTRFLCTGDLHLGAGTELGREPGDRLRDQDDVLEQIATIADDRNVDAILFAGDAFDGPLVHPEHYAVWRRQLAAQRVIAISGNGRHDTATRTVKAPEVVMAELATQPDVVHVGDVAIARLPWAPVGWLVAQHDGGDRDDINAYAARLLVEIARDLRARVDGRAVLMLHWSIEGAALPNGLKIEEHAREPIVPLGDLEQLGYDAVVAGHIHRPQLLTPGPLVENGNGSHVVDPACPVFYVGSPMPLNFGETATPHGVWILDITDAGARTEFVPVESRPLVTHDLDLTTDDGIFALASLPDVTDAIVRIRYRATEEQARRFDHGAWVRDLYDAGAHKVAGIHADILRENRARVDGATEDLAPLSAVDLWATAQSLDEPERGSLLALTSAYMEAIA